MSKGSRKTRERASRRPGGARRDPGRTRQDHSRRGRGGHGQDHRHGDSHEPCLCAGGKCGGVHTLAGGDVHARRRRPSCGPGSRPSSRGVKAFPRKRSATPGEKAPGRGARSDRESFRRHDPLHSAARVLSGNDHRAGA